MKIRTSIVLAAVLAVGGVATAADMSGMKMEKPQTNHAVGVVKAVDVAAGTITLSHEAVPSLGWPAMTMAFRASREQASGVKPGDRVDFEFVAKGMDATITSISMHK